jgi:vitamin B12 transporter
MRVSIGAVFLCLASLLLSSSISFLFAQSSEPIHGVVVDPSHAAIPKASVRLIAGDGTEAAHTITDQQGRFSFQQHCDSCSLEVQLTGFRTTRVPASAETREIELQLAPVEESVVVTPNRTETPAVFVGSTTSVITKDEIDARQAPVVGDLLQSVPGVIVNRSGGYGAVTSMFTRGGDSDYTKVLLDGIPLNQPGGLFDFSTLQAANVDRIELVRGPQSALFGSDAMTGVVQFFSRRGDSENRRPQFTLNADGGNFETINAGADVNGSVSRFDYDAFWSRFSTNNQGIDADFQDSTVGTNLGLNLGKTKLRWILRDDLSHVGNPGQTAFGPAIDDSFAHRGDGYTGVSIQNQTSKIWRQDLTYTFDRTRYVSKDFGLDAPFTPTFDGHVSKFQFFDFPSNFLNDVRRHQVDYQSGFTFGSGTRDWGQHILTLAVSWDHELGAIGDRTGASVPTHHELDDVGGVFQYQVLIGRVSLTNGFRVEGHSTFGKTVIPRSSAAYLLRRGGAGFGATKLKFNFGLGFKEPSLVQLFSPDPTFLGNPRLRPERDRSFDFGIEQRVWNDRAKAEINWFDNSFRDLVEFNTISLSPFTANFINVDAAKATGAEVIVETAPAAGLKLQAAYTYLNTLITRSPSSPDTIFAVGNALQRRPRHSGSLGAVWNWRKLTASSTLTYVGTRVDTDFAGLVPPLTSDPSYTRLDLAWTYRVTRRFSYVGAITNALDRHYMEALGYPALTTTFRTGGRFTF